MKRRTAFATVLVAAWIAAGSVWAQQVLLDRVVARVEGQTVTLSDVRAAIGLGLIEGDEQQAIDRLIDRQLMVNEVQRFPPPEPAVADVEAETRRLEATPGLDALLASTGIDRRRVQELARETLRIRSYMNQRFGETGQVGDNRQANIDRWLADLRGRANISRPLASR